MPLSRCKICGELFGRTSDSPMTRYVCQNCFARLEGVYNQVHKYLKTHEPQKVIDARKLAYELGEDQATIQMLIDDGWLERDVQTYSGITTKRQELAEKFEQAIERMKSQQKMRSSYGGEIYSRKK